MIVPAAGQVNNSPGDRRLFYPALKIAQSFKPLNEAEMEKAQTLALGLRPLFGTPPK